MRDTALPPSFARRLHRMCVAPHFRAAARMWAVPSREPQSAWGLAWARALALTLALFVAGPALAQDGLDEVENALQRGAEQQQNAGVERLVSPPMVDDAAAETRWSFYRESIGTPESGRTFETFRSVSLELGYPLLPQHAAAVYGLQRTALAQGNVALATDLRGVIADVAVGQPILRWADLDLDIRQNPWAIASHLTRLVGAIQAEWGTPGGRVSMTRWLVRAAHQTALLYLLLFAVALLWSHGERLTFDLRLLCGRVPSWRQAGVMLGLGAVTAAIMLPFWVFGSAVMVLLALHASRREWLGWLLAALCIPLALSPPAVPEVDVELAEWVSVAPASPCGARCQAALEPAAEGGSQAARLALAWHHYRRGTTSELEQAAALLEGTSSEGEMGASALLLRGHLAMVATNAAAADEQYRAALEQARNRLTIGTIATALTRTSRMLGNEDAMQQMVRTSVQSGHPMLDRWTRYEGRSQNPMLPVWTIPAGAVLASVSGGTWDLWLAEWQPWSATPVLALWASLVGGLLLAAGLRATHLRSERCKDCGSPTHLRVLRPAFHEHQCVWCYQAALPSLRLSFEEQHAREYRADRRNRVRRTVAWIGAFVLPGLPLVAGLAPAWGTIALGLAAVGTALLVQPAVWLSHGGSASAAAAWLAPAYWGVLVLGIACMVGLAVTAVALRRRSA